MAKRVVLAGGTGFMGQCFEKKFRKAGYDIAIIPKEPILTGMIVITHFKGCGWSGTCH